MPPQRLVARFVLAAATLVVLLAVSRADGAHVVGSRKNNVVEVAGPVKRLWGARVGNGAPNAPYLDPASNQLYVNSGGFAGNPGTMAILDAKTGAVIKSVKTRAWKGFSSVVPVAGTMVCANEYNTTACRSKKTLALVWEFETQFNFQTTPLYVPSKNAVYAINSASDKMYKFNAKTGKMEKTSAKLPGAQTFHQRPVFSKQHNLAFVGNWHYVVAVNADTLDVAWNAPTGRVDATGVLSEDESTIYVPSFGVNPLGAQVYALDTATGRTEWRFELPGERDASINTPSLHNGVLYVGSAYKDCYALNATTGKQIWAVPLDTGFIVRVHQGNSHIYGDTVLFPGADGIFAVALNGSGIVWKWPGAEGAVHVFPAPTADGKLFLSTSFGYAYALQLPAPGAPPSGKKGIVEKRCAAQACSSQCDTRQFSTAKCIQTGPTSSLARLCSPDGTFLTVKTFPEDAACRPSSNRITEDNYEVGKCYEFGAGGSFEVTECSA